MENEWLDLAYIKHGQIVSDYTTVQIEQVLTQELVEDLNYKHQREMRKLLRSFIK